ncbi:MAG TPA: DUF3467 domain-containing protein [Bacteroidales bacterium]|jgi:hypothetical protein|nr:DUF3467 domain-containing protein [Bacteroidales bacterium]HOF45632.1 DUF3467 domain-containing protein [Bacteroidales bacterium]HOS57381.1 DUF3467 domain-containing protein [Bacteroidales bacterium]HPY81336.1 DUF3467 domain-containing protein [Bacteroidales bacterium]HRR04312.1 DUF3467 domain-containing protein [Bacteroidales bacterium]
MQEQKIEINIKEEVAHGIYSNLAIITHSNVEFIVDFVSVMPGIPKGEVRSRIILNPQNAKRLLNALSDNIQKFEEKNGKINENSQDLLPIITKSGGMA